MIPVLDWFDPLSIVKGPREKAVSVEPTDLPVQADLPNIALVCFIAYRAMEERVLRDLASAGFDDITVAQARIFARVGPHGTRIGDLADQARVTKQTAGFLVGQLKCAGYVNRVIDPTDGRARLVVIAERGLAALEVAGHTEATMQAEWTRHLGGRATAQLHRTLIRLQEITDPYWSAPAPSPGVPAGRPDRYFPADMRT